MCLLYLLPAAATSSQRDAFYIFSLIPLRLNLQQQRGGAAAFCTEISRFEESNSIQIKELGST
jgi:hypothetical protein